MNRFVQKCLPIILSVIGSVGVVGTAVLAAKASPKASKKLEELGDEKDYKKIIKEVVPIYGPTILVGTATIASIVTGAVISKKTEVSLTGAMLALDKGYKKYEHKVKEVLGLDAHKQVVESIAKDEVKDTPQDASGRKLYYNRYIGKFYAKPENVLTAIHNMNMRMNATNKMGFLKKEEMYYCTLEQFINEAEAECLDKELVGAYSMYGWSREYLDCMNEDNWIYVSERDDTDSQGNAYIVLDFITQEPIYDPYNFDAWSDYYKHNTYISDKEDSDIDVAIAALNK